MLVVVGTEVWQEDSDLTVKLKVEPCCQTLCAVICPPIISVNFLLMAKPNPVPPY